MLNALEERIQSAEGALNARTRKLQDCSQCSIRCESLCSVLDTRELVAFEKIGRKMSLRARSNIFAEGERAAAVFNVTSGFVRLHRLSASGRCQVVGFAFPGDFLGLPAMEHYGVSADTVVPTTLCRFPNALFQTFACGHPRLLKRLHDAAMLTLDRAQDQMLLLGPCRAEAKIAAFLLMMKKRWTPLRGDSAAISLPMRRQDIGDYLGLSIATVSRTLQRMCRQQVVRFAGKSVHILDRERLEQMALT